MINKEKATSTHIQDFTNNKPLPFRLSLKTKHSPKKIKALEKAWLEENQEAIKARNEHFEKHGLFGEEFRGF